MQDHSVSPSFSSGHANGGKEYVALAQADRRDRLRNKWGDKASKKEGYHTLEGAQLSGGLEILYLEEGQTMTPVRTDPFPPSWKNLIQL